MDESISEAEHISSCVDRYVLKFDWASHMISKCVNIQLKFHVEKRNVTWFIKFTVSPSKSSITFSTNPVNALGETHQIICCLFQEVDDTWVNAYEGHQLALGKKLRFFTWDDLSDFAEEDGWIRIIFDLITFDQSTLSKLRPELPMLPFFESGEYSDVTITTAQKEFKVHKLVLASRSPFFAAMFRHDMREMNTGSATIENVSTEVLEEMLRYMYSNACPKLSKMPCELYAAAHLYDIRDLQDLCVDYLLKNIRVDIVIPTLKLCDTYGLEKIRERAVKFVNDNEALLVKQQEYLVYLQENLRVDDIAKNLLLAKKYELFEFQLFLMDFIAKNYAQVMKNDDYRQMYMNGKSMEMILEIDEYISNNIAKLQV